MWQDECRASINASKIAPNLTDKERSYLILDAIYRAHEYGQTFELDDYMKGVLYGNFDEKPIIPIIQPIRYISEESLDTGETGFADYGDLSEMPEEDYDDIER